VQIARADFWPGMTFAQLLDMPHDLWLGMVLTCDEQVDRIRAANAKRGHE
jgi:hypothetical protein